MPKATDIQSRFRSRLIAELQELRDMSTGSAEDRAPVKLDQQSVGRLSRMDGMQMQAMAVASERRRQLRIAKLNAALSRLDDGEFGYCLTCGDPIEAGRLDVDPTAHLCLSCARLNER